MREIMHFNSLEERLAYLRGGYEEIVPVEVKETPNTATSKTEGKSKKKKAKKIDEVQTK